MNRMALVFLFLLCLSRPVLGFTPNDDLFRADKCRSEEALYILEGVKAKQESFLTTFEQLSNPQYFVYTVRKTFDRPLHVLQKQNTPDPECTWLHNGLIAVLHQFLLGWSADPPKRDDAHFLMGNALLDAMIDRLRPL